MRICIKGIAKESFCAVWHHKLEWIRIAFAPVLIWCVGFLLIQAIAWVMETEITIFENSSLIFVNPVLLWNLGPMALAGTLIYFFMNITALNTFYINGLRYAVYGDYKTDWLTFQWNKRLIRLILYSFCITGVTMAAGASLVFILQAAEWHWSMIALGTLLTLGWMYVKVRISLYDLLIAADSEHPLRKSWHLLGHHVFKLFFLLLVIGLAIGLMTAVILGTIHGLMYLIGSDFSDQRGLVSGAIWFFALTVYIQAYASVYKAVQENAEDNNKS